MKNYEIRAATREDLMRWYEGKLPPVSSRAIVLEINGKLEAICGVQTSRGEIVAFSNISLEGRKNKRALVEGLRRFRELVEQHACVIAYADKNEPTASAFLEHVGFTHAGHALQGEAYIYGRNGSSSTRSG